MWVFLRLVVAITPSCLTSTTIVLSLSRAVHRYADRRPIRRTRRSTSAPHFSVGACREARPWQQVCDEPWFFIVFSCELGRPCARAFLSRPGLRDTSHRCGHGGRFSVTAVGQLLGPSRKSAAIDGRVTSSALHFPGGADRGGALPCTCSQKNPTINARVHSRQCQLGLLTGSGRSSRRRTHREDLFSFL